LPTTTETKEEVMALKTYINTLEEVSESLQEFYKPKGDGFSLDLEGEQERSALKEKLKEFRDNNVHLQNELEAVKTRFADLEDLDPNDLKEAIQAHRAVKEKEMVPAIEMDRLVSQKVLETKKKYEKEIEEAKQLANRLQMEMSRMTIEKTVTEAINQVGQLQKGALPDVLRRAQQEIEVKEERLIDRSTGLSIDPVEWAQGLYKSSAYFFSPNSGIGSKGSGGEPIRNNPFSKEHLNLSEQAKLYRENPNEARRLAREAGATL
jgi:hypothetical protein